MNTPREVLAEGKKLGLPDKFCSVPFIGLLIEPDGKVGLCRIKGDEAEIGNLHENSILEIWNSPKAQAWRQEFLDGKPITCKTEVRHKQCHRCIEQNIQLKPEDLTVVQRLKPRRIAFNLNGKCNLECVMCTIWQKPNGLYDKNGFWDQFDDLITDLVEVELLSGEPFIQKDTYKLINMISARKPEARWVITTNLNWKLTPYIKDHLDKIAIRNLIVSIDSPNPVTYPLIRKNGNLSLLLRTLQDLGHYEKERIACGLSGLQIQANFLVQKLNWHELKEINDFKKKYKVNIFRTFLYEPFEHSVLSLPEAERIAIVEFYLENLTPDENNLNVILPILDSLPPIFKAQYFTHLKSLSVGASC